ncbi:MAG: hypothetical protein IT210_19305 [Armatimonadetes bacterium]|nr:hypothetical protein [Armatimonadota bacterium]
MMVQQTATVSFSALLWGTPRICILWWLNLYLWIRFAAPYITLFDGTIAGIIVATLVFMLLQLALIYDATRLSITRLQAFLSLLFFVFLFIVMARFRVGMLADICLILASASLGYLVSTVIKEPNLILPVAVVGALVDYWGVHFGPTQMVLSKAPQVLQTMSAKIPALGQAARAPGGLPYIAMIGPGDFLFLAIFYACVHKFGMNGRATYIWTAVLLTLGMLVALMTPVFYIPALVPMGVAVMAANWKYFKFKREEFFALLYAGIFIVVLVFLFIIYLDKMKPEAYNKRDVNSAGQSQMKPPKQTTKD